MYTFKRAIGALENDVGSIQFIDISESILKNIITGYRVLFIEVGDEIYGRDITINLLTYRNELSGFDGNIQQWLDSKSKVNLESSNEPLPDSYQYAKLYDLEMEKFVPYPADYNWSTSMQAKLTMAGATDIRMKRADVTDYDKLVNGSLFLCNGHFVRGVSSKEGVYLLGAAKNLRVNDLRNFGCISMGNLCTLKTSWFNESQIVIEDDGEFGSSLRITFDKPINDITLWFVIGGKLVVDKNLVYKVSDTEIKLNVDQFLLTTNVFESANYIDLTDITGIKEGIVRWSTKAKLLFIKQLLLNTNSFFIRITNPYIGIYVEPLETYGYPTSFLGVKGDKSPVMLSNGMFPTYRIRPGIGGDILDVCIHHNQNYLSDSYGDIKPNELTHNRIHHGNPRSPLLGYYFKIYSLIKR